MTVYLSLALAVLSQNPPPSPAKAGQPAQQQATEKRDATNPASPAGVPIQPVADSKPEDDKGEPPSNWWLVGFTGGLLFVAFLQWRTFERHATLFESSGKLLEKHTAIMNAQVDAIQLQAARISEGNATLIQQRIALDQQVEVMQEQSARLREAAAIQKEQRAVLQRVEHIIGQMNVKDSRMEATFKEKMTRLTRAVRGEPKFPDEPQ